jgi:hypothetical protein
LESAAHRAVFSKLERRLIPLLLIAYLVSYLDRINIGCAPLQMKQTLSFDGLRSVRGHLLRRISCLKYPATFRPPGADLSAVAMQAIKLSEDPGLKVSLGRWSRGGIIAREVARKLPTPFA